MTARLEPTPARLEPTPPEMIGGRAVHPLAAAFPLVQGDAFAALVEDIRVHGLRVPIVIDRDGRIADGRNRLRAAIEAGVAPTFEVFDGDDEALLAFVASANLARRHMTPAQAAMVAARLVVAMRATGFVEGRASERIARQCGVPARTIDEALAVIQKGVPDLVRLAETGALGISVAARLARVDVETQAAVVSQGVAATRDFARDERTRTRAEPAPGPVGQPRRPRTSIEASAPSPPRVELVGVPDAPHVAGADGAVAADTAIEPGVPDEDDAENSHDMDDAVPPEGFTAWTATCGWMRLRIEIEDARIPRLRNGMRTHDPAHAVIELILAQISA